MHTYSKIGDGMVGFRVSQRLATEIVEEISKAWNMVICLCMGSRIECTNSVYNSMLSQSIYNMIQHSFKNDFGRRAAQHKIRGWFRVGI